MRLPVEAGIPGIWDTLITVREQKIVFFGRYIVEKSVFGRHREEKIEEKLIKGKIGKIADFSP